MKTQQPNEGFKVRFFKGNIPNLEAILDQVKSYLFSYLRFPLTSTSSDADNLLFSDAPEFFIESIEGVLVGILYFCP